MAKRTWVVGVDEVGRGSLAGPVTVAAVAVRRNLQLTTHNLQLGKLKDSKKLSPEKRRLWLTNIKKNRGIFYALAHVSPRIIDKINVSKAANLAASRTLLKLTTNNQQLTTKRLRVFLDGGLYINESLVVSHKLLVRTVVRGDEKIRAIMLASIVAKVYRDRLMTRLHKKYPEYNFDVHKGYGTKMHRSALQKRGPSNAHRLTFLSKCHKVKA